MMASTSPTVKARGAAVTRELAVLREMVEGGKSELTFAEARDARKALRSVFQPARPAGGGIPPAPPEHAAALVQAERALAGEMDEAAKRVLAENAMDPGLWKKANSQLSSAIEAEQIVVKASGQAAGNRAVSLTDYMSGVGMGVGMLASGNLAGLGYGVGTSIAHKFVRERGNSTMAVLAKAMAKREGRIDSVARKLAGMAEGGTRRGITAGGIFAEPDPDDEPEPAHIESRPTTARIDPEETRKAIERVRQLQQMSPVKRMEVLSDSPVMGALATSEPRVASRVMEQALKMQDVLATQLPQPHTRSATIQPGVEPVHMSPVERQRFARFSHGVEDPMSVLEDLGSGNIDRQALKGFEMAHPADFEDVRSRVQMYAAENEDRLPPARRRALGMAFHFPADSSLEPAAIQASQTSWDTESEAEQEKRQGQRRNDDGLSSDLARNMTTQSERLEGSPAGE
jgi:hypothetical protein